MALEHKIHSSRGIKRHSTDLEVTTIEGALRINDHQADVPFEKGAIIKLIGGVSI